MLLWFALTHELEPAGLKRPAVWRLKRYPRAGGVNRQEAWLLGALRWAREVANHLVQRRGAGATDELRAFHDAQRDQREERVH